MTAVRAWIAVIAAALIAVAGVGAAGVARQTMAQAETTRDGALRLREARLGLIEAQNALGNSDLESAVEGAERANAAALDVRSSTEALLRRLEGLAGDVADVTATSEASGRSLRLTRDRMRLAAALLEAVRAEQHAASDATAYSTRFLKRILAAVRETNRSFP